MLLTHDGEREAVPRAAELYQALARGSGSARHNPIAYVSSSPTNVASVVATSLAAQRDLVLDVALLQHLALVDTEVLEQRRALGEPVVLASHSAARAEVLPTPPVLSALEAHSGRTSVVARVPRPP
ncbi:MAG: hypothetical protein M3Y87_07045 [Myxococcota bacterium]|nr:hypothetical protein [Myxococcota bacterium]